jgi:hypothetical protein
MSISTKAQQARMLAIGDQIFALAGEFAVSQGAVDGDDYVSAVGQTMMQAALGHCEANAANLSLFVYGAAYAIGSMMAQVGPENARHVFRALQGGMANGGDDAARSFGVGGRA